MNQMRELNNAELMQIAGGIGIGSDGRDFEVPIGDAGNPYGGLAGGSPKIPLGQGGRDWWVPLPSPGKP